MVSLVGLQSFSDFWLRSSENQNPSHNPPALTWLLSLTPPAVSAYTPSPSEPYTKKTLATPGPLHMPGPLPGILSPTNSPPLHPLAYPSDVTSLGEMLPYPPSRLDPDYLVRLPSSPGSLPSTAHTQDLAT